jgi:hypothetical protein
VVVLASPQVLAVVFLHRLAAEHLDEVVVVVVVANPFDLSF